MGYHELLAQARDLALYVKSRIAVVTNSLIGLWIHRSISMVVGFWGTVVAGCAYVLIDIKYPRVQCG